MDDSDMERIAVQVQLDMLTLLVEHILTLLAVNATPEESRDLKATLREAGYVAGRKNQIKDPHLQAMKEDALRSALRGLIARVEVAEEFARRQRGLPDSRQ